MRRLCLLFCLCILTVGCGNSSKNWLVGEWVVDKELTEANLDKNDSGGLEGSLISMLLSQFEGATLKYTKDEIYLMKSGSGKAVKYEIIESKGDDNLVVKQDDGKVHTYQKVETGFWTTTNGDVQSKIYFKPKSK